MRRNRLKEAAAASQVAVLVLAPFSSCPRVSFDNVRLGSAAVRRLTVQNPGGKRLQVALGGVDKAREAGFEVDHAVFSLGPRQEATIRIGWVPREGGNAAEKINVRCVSRTLWCVQRAY